MSESIDRDPTERNDDEPITVWYEGVSLEKRVEHYRDDVVKVLLHISSDREDPVRIQLVDQLPESIEADRVGFHPEYDPDAWEIGEDRSVVYETRLAPGAEQETVYGVEVSSSDSIDSFASRPIVELSPVDDASGENDTAVSEPDRTIGTPIDSQRPTSIDPDPQDDSSPEQSFETALGDVTNGTEDNSLGPSTTEDEESPSAEEEPQSPFSELDTTETSDSVVSALVDELESRQLGDDERATLREALDLDQSSSDQVRLEHVQATVDDLVAYRDALEGFIDDNGPAEALVEELRTGLDARKAEIESLQASLEDLRVQVEDLEDAHEAETNELESRLDGLDADLSETRTAFEEDFEVIETDLSRLLEWREKLSVATQLADAGVDSNSTAD